MPMLDGPDLRIYALADIGVIAIVAILQVNPLLNFKHGISPKVAAPKVATT
jgi:hypothetical protein